MTIAEMNKRIDELERRRFYLSMKDHWSAADFESDRKMWQEVLTLKKEVAKLEG